MKTGKVVHVRKTPFDIYIGRAFAEFSESKWHNPIHLRKNTLEERIRVLEEFKQYILGKPDLLADLYELDGKVLGCWCRPKMCHGDVLLELRAAQISQPNR